MELRKLLQCTEQFRKLDFSIHLLEFEDLYIVLVKPTKCGNWDYIHCSTVESIIKEKELKIIKHNDLCYQTDSIDIITKNNYTDNYFCLRLI